MNRAIPHLRGRTRRRRSSTWLVAAILGVALGSAGREARAALTPDQQRQLATAIQQRRPDQSADPAATRDLGWLRWQTQHARCRSTADMLWAMAVDNDCGRITNGVTQGEMLKVLEQIYDAALSLPMILDAPDEVLVENLEAVAAAFDVPQNAVKCLAKTYIRATQPDGPARQATLLRIDAAADALSIVEFTGAMRELQQQGVVALGETVRDGAVQGTKLTATGTTQPGGWMENLAAAAETFHAGKMAAMTARQARARQRLDQCVTTESLDLYHALEAEALAYVEQTRLWAMDMEKQIYCAAAAAGVADDSMIDVVATRDLNFHPANIYIFDRLAVDNYEKVVADVRAAEAEAAAKETEVDRLVAELESIQAELDVVWESCDDQAADALARRLGRLDQSACLSFASASAGFTGNIPELQEKLRSFHLARRQFPLVVRRAASEAREKIEQCRFHEVLDPIDERFHGFDTSFAPFSIGGFRHCWPPSGETDPDLQEWPPDAVERESDEARERVLGLLATVRDGMTAAVDLRLECRWPEARAALDEARDALSAIDCPTDAPNLEDYAVSADRLEQLESLTNEHQTTVEPKLVAYEHAARDLLQSIDEELYTAEQPRHDERCAAAERVLEMVGIAAGITPPKECPDATLEGFADRIEDARLRGAAALDLGRAEFAELAAQGQEAVRRCDAAALTSARNGLAALPRLCDVDPQPTRDALDAEALRLDAEIAGYRARIDRYELEWATAYQRCDLTELRAVANAIAAWAPNSCARPNLKPEEQARVASLERNTADRVAAIESLKVLVESALNAKYKVGMGYVNTLSTAAAAQQTATAQLRRIVDDARDYIDFARSFAGPNDLPPICYDDDLDQVRSLVPTLERLIGQIGQGGDAPGAATGSPWDAAAAAGQVTVSSSGGSPPPAPPTAPAPADDQVAAAERVAAGAAAERARRPPPPSAGDILGPLIEVAGAVADARSGGSSGGRAGTPAGLPPPNGNAARGGGASGGTSPTGGAGGPTCSIIAQNLGGDGFLLVEYPSTSASQPVGWSVVAVPTDMGETCHGARACAYELVPGVKEGAARIVPKQFRSWREVECEAFRRCPQPVYTSGVTRCSQ